MWRQFLFDGNCYCYWEISSVASLKNQFFDKLQVTKTSNVSLFQISRPKFKGKSKLSECRCNLKKHLLNFKSSSSILWHLKSNICAHVESRYFLFFKIFQELDKIFKIRARFLSATTCYSSTKNLVHLIFSWLEARKKNDFFLEKSCFFWNDR